MLGSAVIWIAFVSALVASALYFFSIKSKKFITLARIFFHISIYSTILASILLLLYILQHRFEFNYIWAYSSRELPTALLVTTFWGGQEGSLLLWALIAAFIGLFIKSYSKQKGIESYAISIYSFIMSILLLLIAVKSPFQYLWEVYKEAPVGFIPQNGRGLNPLLQNFWMIIHPPVLFIGFASLAVPYVIAVGSLWQKKYKDWIHITLPWVLFGAISLGAGLIFGGYWAYGVLGWGGWWGWDPVENSSLVPFIVAVILIHTMLIQMRTGRLVKTNFILAVLVYLLVVYSTFLTRSGILSNVSVHSFVDPGGLAYSLIVLWLFVIAIVGFGMIILRRNELKHETATSPWLTRESILSFAFIVMGLCAAIILIATSKPLFSDSAVEPSFYNKTNLPFAILMTLLLAISVRTKWNQEEKKQTIKSLIIPAVLAIIILIVLFFFGLNDLFAALLVLTSLFALLVSVHRGYQIAKEQPRFLGGVLSHIGLALLFIGIIASGKYGQKKPISLPINQPVVVFGDTLIYTGASATKDGKYKFPVKLIKNNRTDVLEPVMFESSYNKSVMRNPDYISFLDRDFYIEPVSIEEGCSIENERTIILPKGDSLLFGPMQITFKRFDFSAKNREKMISSSDAMTIGAVLEVKTRSEVQMMKLITTFNMHGQPEPKTVYLKNSSIGFQLLSMNVASSKESKSTIQVKIIGLESIAENRLHKPETLIAEISVKPFMNLVWIAAFLIILGCTVAMIRRFKQSDE